MSVRWGAMDADTKEITVLEDENDALDWCVNKTPQYYLVVDRGDGWTSPYYKIDMRNAECYTVDGTIDDDDERTHDA